MKRALLFPLLIALLLVILLSLGNEIKSGIQSTIASERTKTEEIKGRTTQAKPIKPPPYKEAVIFSGQVVSTWDKAIESANVEINGKIVKTNSNGHFKIAVKPSNRFVMNIRKKGFGLVSKIYTTGIQDGLWVMTKATTQFFDPTKDILIKDIRPPDICKGTLSSRVDWSRYPNRRIPRYIDSEGLISWEVPEEAKKAIEFAENCNTCNPGISITIPANSLVDSNGNLPIGNVTVSLSTVDIYDPSSMPGDYTVDLGNRTGYMLTYGAGTVNVSSNGKKYILKKGTKSTLTVPINSAQLKQTTKLAKSIPFLLYDEKKGVWRVFGEARLDVEKNAYVAEIDHFSAFNMDLVKTDQACVRIDSTAINQNYDLEISIPYAGDVIVRTVSVDNTTEKIHAIYNLPSYTNIVLRAFTQEEGDPITDTITVNTGEPQDPADPNCPIDPYDACNSQVVLTELTEATLAPVLSGPATSTGTFVLSWDYEFVGMASTANGYVLEELTTLPNSEFSSIYPGAYTDDQREHVDYEITRSIGDYWYRVKFMNATGWTPYSNVVHVVVTAEAARQLKITNQVGSQRLEEVVQVKIIPIGYTYSTDDLLTSDSLECLELPGESIDRGDSRTFDVTIGDDYLVFIGLGIWETDLVAELCPFSSPWFKRRFFLDPNFNLYYVWNEVVVGDHFSDVWEWTITGSYTGGNLYLNPTDNPSLPFQITDWDPLY